MERFWRTYKHESFLQRDPGSLEEAMEMTAEWLEYYNKERSHSALGYRSPEMYREFSASARLAALELQRLRYKIVLKMV